MPESITNIDKLTNLAKALRDKKTGCPWDLAQTQQSLTSYTLEETHELIHAIVANNPADICEELGDLLFHIVLYAQIASENPDNEKYDLNAIIDKVESKMIRRHPHVFANKTYANLDAQLADWDAIKQQEKLAINNAEKSEKMSPDERDLDVNTSLFDKHISALPAILQAVSMQKTMKKLGFDWDNAEQVFPKVIEELDELKIETNQDVIDKNKVTEEFGDLLFACINLGRQLDIDADFALRSANTKFARRSRAMLDLAGDKLSFSSKTLMQKEQIWQDVKKFEKIANEVLNNKE